jgi:hypothetical protein
VGGHVEDRLRMERVAGWLGCGRGGCVLGQLGVRGSEEASGLMVGVRSCVTVNYYMLREDEWPLKDGVPWVGL